MRYIGFTRSDFRQRRLLCVHFIVLPVACCLLIYYYFNSFGVVDLCEHRYIRRHVHLYEIGAFSASGVLTGRVGLGLKEGPPGFF